MLGTGDALEDSLSSAGTSLYCTVSKCVYIFDVDHVGDTGDIGDTRALLEQSGSSAMQALRFDSCQVLIRLYFLSYFSVLFVDVILSLIISLFKGFLSGM